MVSYKKAIPIGLLATFVTLSSNLKSIYSGTNSPNTNESEKEKITAIAEEKSNQNTSIMHDIYKFASNYTETTPPKIEDTSAPVKETPSSSNNKANSSLENTVEKEAEKNRALEIKPSANERKYPSESGTSSAKGSTAPVNSAKTKSSTPTASLGLNINELSEYNIRRIAETYLSQVKNSEKKDKYILQHASIEDLDDFMHSMANYKINPKEEAFDRALRKVLQRKTPESHLIDFYMLKASAWQESRYNQNIVSHKNAVGDLQLTEATYLTQG